VVHTVTGSKGDTYHTDPEAGRCSCPDAVFRKRECRHLRGLRLAERGGQYAPAGLVSKRPGVAVMSFEEV
jgi:predicted nucleic acid-binding Zn finger protein